MPKATYCGQIQRCATKNPCTTVKTVLTVDCAPDDCCPALSVTWHATLLAKGSANSCCYTPRNSAFKMRKVGGDVSQWNSL